MHHDIIIKDLGEYIPGSLCSVTLNGLKKFVNVLYHIDWYKSSESKKVFPLFIQELSDLNPARPGLFGLISRNPFFDHTQIKYFIAYKEGGEPVGRIAAFIDYNYSEDNKKTGWVGLFECEENGGTAKNLLDAAIGYLRQNSCKKILGPAKFNAGGEVGLLIDGFENMPYFMEPYNAPYYRKFFEDYGFIKENDWFSVSTDELLSSGYMDRISLMAEKFKNSRRSQSYSSYRIRNIRFSDVKNEIRIIRNLYNPIWNEGRHPQQVYMSDAEFDVLAAGIKEIAAEELIFIVEKDGEPVAVSVNIPDINEVIYDFDISHKSFRPKNTYLALFDISRDLKIFMQIKNRLKNRKFSRLRFLILGIKKEHRKSGVDSMLYGVIKKKALEFGIIHGSASQLADINMDIINPIFKLGKIAMTWRAYGLEI
jgi:hypothetical protein